MENHGKTSLRVMDVAKKLGLQTKDLIRECAECNITVWENDTLDLQTWRHVLSGMYAGEYEWGEELHLENGEVASHINRSHMRTKDKSEYTVSGEMSVAGLATKLGIPVGILLNELKIQWYNHTAQSMVQISDIRTIIDDLEVHTSRDDLVGADIWHGDHTHCIHDGTAEHAVTTCDSSWEAQTRACDTSGCQVLDTSLDLHATTNTTKKTTKIADLATQLGVPATAFVARLHSQGIQDTTLDATQVAAIQNTTKAGKIDRGRYTLAEMWGCADGTCPSHSRYAQWDTDDDDDAWADRLYAAQSSRVVASSEWVVGSAHVPAYHHNLSKLALVLLGFLAVPLLIGLFGDRTGHKQYNTSGDIATVPQVMEIHGAAVVESDEVAVPSIVDAQVSPPLAEHASPKPQPAQPQEVVQKTKKFVAQLIEDVQNSDLLEHSTAPSAIAPQVREHDAPDMLPSTGSDQ